MKGTSARIGAAMGAVFVILLFAGGTMESSGAGVGSDGPGILANLRREPTIVNRVGLALAIVAFLAFLAFLGYLYRLLRRAEETQGWLATVALGGGLLYLAIKVGSAGSIMAAIRRKDELTADLARTLVDLNDAAFVVSGLMFGVFTMAAAAACLRHRVLTRWLGWFGVLAGLLTVVAGIYGVGNMAGYNPVPFLASTLWTLAVAIVLTVRPRPEPPIGTLPARTSISAAGSATTGS